MAPVAIFPFKYHGHHCFTAASDALLSGYLFPLAIVKISSFIFLALVSNILNFKLRRLYVKKQLEILGEVTYFRDFFPGGQEPLES